MKLRFKVFYTITAACWLAACFSGSLLASAVVVAVFVWHHCQMLDRLASAEVNEHQLERLCFELLPEKVSHLNEILRQIMEEQLAILRKDCTPECNHP